MQDELVSVWSEVEDLRAENALLREQLEGIRELPDSPAMPSKSALSLGQAVSSGAELGGAPTDSAKGEEAKAAESLLAAVTQPGRLATEMNIDGSIAEIKREIAALTPSKEASKDAPTWTISDWLHTLNTTGAMADGLMDLTGLGSKQSEMQLKLIMMIGGRSDGKEILHSLLTRCLGRVTDVVWQGISALVVARASTRYAVHAQTGCVSSTHT